jgi:carbonic anhydrase
VLDSEGVADLSHSPEKTVLADVEYLKSFKSLNDNMTIAGLVLDTFTGVLKRII